MRDGLPHLATIQFCHQISDKIPKDSDLKKAALQGFV